MLRVCSGSSQRAYTWHNEDSTSGLLLTQKARPRDTGWEDINIYVVPEIVGVEESIR